MFDFFRKKKKEQELITKQIEEFGHFKLDLKPKLLKLPDYDDKKQLNIRYPLIPPYAFVHIYWDTNENSIIYHLEEPVLTDEEKMILTTLHETMQEIIDTSFSESIESPGLLDYLEKNLKAIIKELGIKIERETYNKFMYYIYRDSIGLNKIEPLLNDYFIEDIECNGVNIPIYIVHRKYGNIRTNVLIKDFEEATDLVEKIAQRSGRYISYASPILDSTLPDGSRVNATYSKDITTRGPTFTIRKFTKRPWTPAHLIKDGTASAKFFAYMWMAIEYKFNMMIIGETASGKTTMLNALVNFIPYEARICSIEDTRELNLAHENWLPSVVRIAFGSPNLLGVKYGGVTMFDLLKESYRQNPDYVIVGEVRGKEASVLFQGMASGHPSFGTFHAESLETLIRRLETPPINLPRTLVNSLDIVCVMIHSKERDKHIRRVNELVEIIEIGTVAGGTKKNVAFKWDPMNDQLITTGDYHLIKRMAAKTGKSIKNLLRELDFKNQLLKKIAKQDISDFEGFVQIIKRYYEDPKSILRKFKIKIK